MARPIPRAQKKMIRRNFWSVGYEPNGGLSLPALAPLAFGQGGGGTITGTVTDPTDW
jgi:hypothetical protein